jgi:phosphonopyruvate decarboxylase
MQVQDFVHIVGADFYAGVPDSQLKPLCNYLINTYGTDSKHHIIAANEGNCTALAAGYYLSTGKIPVVYMQNSGEGNIINPAASLLNDKVYAIPVIFIIGWRGEPNVHDEPQHIFQGEITLNLLKDIDVESFVVQQSTSPEELKEKMEHFNTLLSSGKSVAFVVKKNALTYEEKTEYKNDYSMVREEIIRHITKVSGENPIVSTTGKASRELFEIREANHQGHELDFLTVGSMGHSSSIALSIASQKPDTKIWCIDGDGAVLMHMGAMAVIGRYAPQNMVHIVINNEAHETVGGMPTAADHINLTAIAKACSYPYAICVDNYEDLDAALTEAKQRKELSFIEVKCAIGARENLGRPTTTTHENKQAFMNYLNSL